jgi:hypothetical protein
MVSPQDSPGGLTAEVLAQDYPLQKKGVVKMWEQLSDAEELNDGVTVSHRLKVTGGWIIRTVVLKGASCAVEQTFVSDPHHEWIK